MTRSIAFVTGSSGGFGLLIAVALAKEGFLVIACMRDLDKRIRLQQTAEASGVADSIHIVSLDVTDRHSVDRVVNQTIEQYGRIDVLVNNAGIAIGGYVEEIPQADWEKQFATNFFGLVGVTRAVLPFMRTRGKGTIINMSSISGRIGFPGLAPYTASKHAVEGFSESLRLELLPHGVYVTLIEPGSYKTDIWDKSLSEIRIHSSSPYADQMYVLNKLVNRIAEKAAPPDEVVNLVVKVAKEPAPRLRYPVGKGVSSTIFGKSILPWGWLEKKILNRLRLRDRH